MRLELFPLDRDEAYAYIRAHHRHLDPPARTGYKFAIGLELAGTIVGVAIVGKPQARLRRARYPYLAEVTRLCTDGTAHASSKLYAAAWRSARGMGFRAIGTYTLPEESGASLRAAGYRLLYQTAGGSWNRPSRPRVDRAPTVPKLFWIAGENLVPAPRARRRDHAPLTKRSDLEREAGIEPTTCGQAVRRSSD